RRRAGGLVAYGREVPDALFVLDELGAGLHQADGIDLDVFVQQGHEGDGDVEFLGLNERPLAVEGGIVGDGEIFNLESRRQEAEVHFAERDLAAELGFELGLDAVMVAVDVEGRGEDGDGDDDDADQNSEGDEHFTHGGYSVGRKA